MLRFVEDTAATLEFYPPERAVASAATVALYYPAGGVLQAAASATVDSASTTVGAAASRGARSFTVASASGIAAGRKYLLQEGGRTWEFEIESISSTTLYPRQRLPFAVTTSATVKGHGIRYSLTTAHTATRDDNYRAHWAYTISTVAYTAEQTFSVVSAYPKSAYPTTLDDVTAMYPWVVQHLEDYNLDGVRTLDVVWDQVLIPALSSKGMRIERVRDLEALVPLHVAFVNRHMIENLSMVDDDYVQRLQGAREIAERVLQHVLSDVSWYDADDDLAASGGEEHQVRTHIEVVR